jgi:hypothetical protein
MSTFDFGFGFYLNNPLLVSGTILQKLKILSPTLVLVFKIMPSFGLV